MLNSNSTHKTDITQTVWTASLLKRSLGRGGPTKIARRTGRTVSAVSHVVAGRFRSPTIEAAIARTLHVKREQIFPLGKESGNGKEVAA